MEALVAGGVAAVIGGALVFGLWLLLPEEWQNARIPVSIAAAILAGLTGSQVQFAASPSADDTHFEAQLLASDRVGPIARAFKENDPVEFARFISASDMYRRTENETSALRRAEGAVVIVGRQRYVYLSDADMVRRFHLWRDEMLALSRSDPHRCYQIYTGSNHAFDLLFFDHPDLNRREVELFAQAFAARARVHQPMTDADYLQHLEQIQLRLAASVGDDRFLLSPGGPVVGNEVRFCEVAAELFNQMAAVPEPTRLHAAGEARGTR